MLLLGRIYSQFSNSNETCDPVCPKDSFCASRNSCLLRETRCDLYGCSAGTVCLEEIYHCVAKTTLCDYVGCEPKFLCKNSTRIEEYESKATISVHVVIGYIFIMILSTFIFCSIFFIFVYKTCTISQNYAVEQPFTNALMYIFGSDFRESY
jgi:hypothetical protein